MTTKTNTKPNWKQATAENIAIGMTVRNDEQQVGKITRWPKRGALTVKMEDGTEFKADVTKLEVDLNAPVTGADALPDGEAPAKAKPERTHKEHIVRVVQGREYTYKNHGGGKIDNDDAIAQLLRGKTVEEVYAITAEKLGVTVAELNAAYGSNNAGRQRMTLGNLLRAQAKALEAGLTYVPPMRAAIEKAKRAEERAAKKVEADKAKAEKAAEAATKKAERAEKAAADKLAREQAAAEAAAKKAEGERAKAEAAAQAKVAAEAKAA